VLDVRFIPLGKTYFPELSRGLERGGKGPRIRPTGHRGAQERAPVHSPRPDRFGSRSAAILRSSIF